MSAAHFTWLVWAWTALAGPVALLLGRVTAPYGRHARPGWGPLLPGRLGWVLMEAPAPLLMTVLFVRGPRHEMISTVFVVAWLGHYANRAFVYPLRRRPGPLPASVAAMGAGFNLANALLIGHWLFRLGPLRPPAWLGGTRFVGGAALFLLGLAMNLHADEVLRRLRPPGDTAHHIPRGGLFRFVSCPNYLGEIVEWSGFALATWSPPGLAFAVWTAANLAPRARAHHAWYRARFADYPPERRALDPLPGLLGALREVAARRPM